ncbi:PKD domain-containing protein [Actinoplanes missouriensis]|uniref:PKD domain-containing protein n=1 Tax=Actinoplanes missouriensis TaxID=1866 RepID=UPI0003074F1F|nr:PKD domain-containing protein [Actinoplanes missouriensis]
MFAKHARFPLLLALGATAIVAFPPSPARAENDPPPSPSTGGPTLVDLGSLGIAGRGTGRVAEINSKGQVAATVWADRGPRASILEFGARTDLQAALPSGADSSEAVGITDTGLVAGRVSGIGKEFQSFTWKAGRAQVIDPPLARAVNEKGQIAGDAWVRDPDGEVTQLSAFKDQYIEVTAINESGVVAGVADMTPGGGLDTPRAFRTRPGMPINPGKDTLEYLGGRTLAKDVNDRGQVAGYATDSSGGYVPVIWGADGTPTSPRAPRGGTANAINNAGTAVGMMRIADGAPRAALYQNGGTTDLNTLLPPDSGWTLTEANAINDLGQIAGVGRPEGADVDHAFLLDLTKQGPVIESLTLETQTYPSTEWKQVEAAGTVDGNRVRITAKLVNRSEFFAFTQLRIGETVSGKDLPGGTRDEILSPKETVTEEIEWDTAGFAWTDGAKPVSDRVIAAKLVTGGVTRDGRTAPIVIRPKPVILTHGYKSNAEASWGKYAPILTKGHPLLKGYAVGDGQAPGVLNTGNQWKPAAPTNTLAGNAMEQATYIDGIRKATGATHVDIVAHSMGGLISRKYIQDDMPTASDGKPVVNRLIQLGTPNMGSPCADFLMDQTSIGGVRIPRLVPFMPATLQLTPKYITEVFNQGVTNLNGVPVSNLVGTGNRVPCKPYPDGDIVVPVKSAQYIYQDIPWTGVNHLDMTESADDFETYVKPRLASLSAGRNQPKAKAKAPAAAEPEIASGTTFDTPAATVAAGATETLTVDVPEATVFGVTGALPPTIGITLKRSNGTVAARYAPNSDQARQPIQTLAAEYPWADRWTIEVTNAGTEATDVVLSAWVDGNDLTITTDATADDAGKVTLTARAFAGATVAGVLTDEKGERREVTLADRGDGAYGVVTDALPDGAYAVTVQAEKGTDKRITHTSVQVQRPDTREFELNLTPQPGGTATASPQQDKYKVGTRVTITAKADAGRMPIGWTVDGVAKPAGTLTVTMDRDHDVVAKFGRYSITELGALPGGWARNTAAGRLNDKGQIAATAITGVGDGHVDGQRSRAVRWEDGKLTELPMPPCDEAKGACNSYGSGINEAGDVSGSSSVLESSEPGYSNGSHAVVWSNGTAKDLHDNDALQGRQSAAWVLNDNGQVFGNYRPYNARYDSPIMWSKGSLKRLPEYPQFWSPTAINDKGTVTGSYVTASNWMGPYEGLPATYTNGEVTKLPVPECGDESSSTTSGSANDINHRGDIVGSYFCRHQDDMRYSALLWKDGKPIDLGDGHATAINDAGLIAGFAGVGTDRKPALWLDGTQYMLSDLLAMPTCTPTTADPCLNLTSLLDVNSSGQVLARGTTRELRADGRNSTEARSFLLTPTEANADLRIDQAVSHLTPAPGQTVTWTSTVANSGPDAATGVRADVTLPAGVTPQGCETTRGACKVVGNAVRTTISALPVGATATVTVTGKIAADTAENTALVARAQVGSLAVPDPATADNTASTTSTVMPALSRTAFNFADPVRVGRTSWPGSVTLTNRQPDAMKLYTIDTTGPFQHTDTCPVELAPGAQCTVEFTFTPTEVGAARGELRFTTEQGAAPAFTVALTGTGIEADNAPVIEESEEVHKGVTGKPLVLEIPFTDADLDDTHTARVMWGDEPEADAEVVPRRGGGTVRISRTFTEPSEGVVVLTVTDSKKETAYGYVWYAVTRPDANTAPSITAGPDVALTTGERFQRTVTFTDPTSTSWTATADYGDGERHEVPVSDHGLALDHTWAKAGSYPVSVTVTDDGGLSTTARFTATVTAAQTPNTAPKVEFTGAASLTEGGTWTGRGTITDPDADTWTATADFGDGPQPVELNGKSFDLSHLFTDDGSRTVAVRVTDDKGGSATATQVVKVANAAPVITLRTPGQMVATGALLTFEASFTDAGAADTHTASWKIGGKAYEGAVAEANGKGATTLPHLFTKAGRYSVTLTVKDDDDGGTTTSQEIEIMVYDPATSIVGAGVTASPAGSCILGGICGTGSAAGFALHAAYPKKAGTPAGELRYTAAGFELRSSSLTVLAAADGKALLRGTAKANGAEVTFEATATDSGRPLDRTDSLRLVVTSKSGKVIYDNQRSGTKSPVIGVIRISD